MNWWKVATLVLLVTTPFVIGAYDLTAYLHGGNDATISRTILDTAREYPLFPLVIGLMVGLLLGHLFLPQHLEIQ